MIHMGGDLLLCDMAEYYHIYITDWESPPFPLSYLAILASGLSNDSRTKRKISNVNLTLSESLEATIVDKLSILAWQKTKDGVKGRNVPKSLYRKLEGLEKEPKDELQSFATEEDFLEWYNNKMR